MLRRERRPPARGPRDYVEEARLKRIKQKTIPECLSFIVERVKEDAKKDDKEDGKEGGEEGVKGCVSTAKASSTTSSTTSSIRWLGLLSLLSLHILVIMAYAYQFFFT